MFDQAEYWRSTEAFALGWWTFMLRMQEIPYMPDRAWEMEKLNYHCNQRRLYAADPASYFARGVLAAQKFYEKGELSI
jgi:hypothetical protein